MKVISKKKPRVVLVQIGCNLNWVEGKKHGTIKIVDKAERDEAKALITKYNSTTDEGAKRLRSKIDKLFTPKETAKKEEVSTKKSNLRIEKKVVERNSNVKVELKKPIKVTEADKKQVKEQVELAKNQRYYGYKHPITGKMWDGEKYI